MLFGVVSTTEDTRDWSSIMSSSDILTSVRQQTGLMHDPKVDIQSNFNDEGISIEQIALIKDSKGNILRSLPNSVSLLKSTSQLWCNKKSIPTNITSKLIRRCSIMTYSLS